MIAFTKKFRRSQTGNHESFFADDFSPTKQKQIRISLLILLRIVMLFPWRYFWLLLTCASQLDNNILGSSLGCTYVSTNLFHKR